MNESFGAAALRLCSAASALLGWRPADFWAATPAELATALDDFSTNSQPLDAATLEELRRRFPDG